MKVSLNWIRSLNDKYHCAAEPAPDGIDKLIERIGAQIGAVEEVINLGERYKGILAAKVISAQKHPNADKLKACWIDDGGVVKGVKRNEEGHIHVVCGAPNVAAGQLVAWLPPGTVVPSTFDKDPFVLEAREIRGEISNGMIASAKELAIGDDHEGILVIDQQAKPGDDFAKIYSLDDFIIDIENKMFTHRPDLFGQLGISREIAGVQRQVFKSPDWYKEDATLKTDGRNNGLKLEVNNELPKQVPRFCALVIKDVAVRESPVWLRVRLSSAGVRPINNIVDITNYFMLETAQPLHAYDYDKVKTGILGVRLSKKGENLRLLGGKEIKLEDGAVVITDGKKPIGLGGIMGGADTEVDENTKNIVLECANFDMNITRKTAMAYGLFTDAATRFTKNQSPRQNRAVIIKAADDILNLAGGRISGPLIDDKHFSEKDITVHTDTNFINGRLGLKLNGSEIKKLLENVEFTVSAAGDKLSVTAPFWRTDIEIPEDIVEEVGRLYGYDKLPVVLPSRDLSPAPANRMLDMKAQLRQILKQSGANEALTYSFVHESLLDKTGQDKQKAFHIRNAISPDLQRYRLSLVPSLLEKVHPNIKAGFDSFCLFELGRAHVKSVNDAEKLPAELERIGLVIADKEPGSGAPFYAAKQYVEYALSEIGAHGLNYKNLAKDMPDEWQQAAKAFEPQRSAMIYAGGQLLGIIGEPSHHLKQSLKLPKHTAQAEIDLSTLLKLASPASYQPLNRFPELEQDFCLRSDIKLTYRELTDFMSENLKKLSADKGYAFRLEPLDIFQKPGDVEHKQTTWRIILSHPERTLTTEETNKLLDGLAGMAKKELNAERI